MSKTTKEEKYVKAKKRVEELKGFYSHALVYVGVNLLIFFSNIWVNYNEGYNEWYFQFPLFGWGIGLFFHWLGINNTMLGKNWEERKIQELMDKE